MWIAPDYGFSVPCAGSVHNVASTAPGYDFSVPCGGRIHNVDSTWLRLLCALQGLYPQCG